MSFNKKRCRVQTFWVQVASVRHSDDKTQGVCRTQPVD